MAKEEMLSHRRILPLDGIRGIAVLMVLGIHFLYSGAFPQPPPFWRAVPHVLNFGWMGVDLFFVLSGFLITGILVDTRRSDNFFRSFYIRRALRIFPLYYLVILTALLTIPLQRMSPQIIPSIPESSGWIYFFLYLNNWWVPLAHGSAGYVGLFWSLAVEEQFYIVWPFLTWWLKPRMFLTLCCTICLGGPLFRMGLYLHHVGPLFTYMATISRMDSLVWGALAAQLVRAPSVWERHRRKLPWIALLSAVLLLIIEFPLHEFYSRAVYTQTIGFTVIAVLFTSFLLIAYNSNQQNGRLGRFLSTTLLTQFGRYSYAMYLLHSFIFIMFEIAFSHRSWFGQSFFLACLLYLLFHVVCFALAFFSFHLYEKHFLRLKAHFEAATATPEPPPPSSTRLLI